MRKRKFSSNEQVNDVFIVETIRKKKIRSNKEPLYFIKWKDWDDKYNTWEPQSNILDKSLIDIFEEEQREKQKTKRENSKLQDIEVAKETEIKSFPVELNHDDQIIKNKCVEKSPNEENLRKLNNETESRPKICLKILKHRIQVPSLKVSEKPVVNGLYDQEIEKTIKTHSPEDDWKFSSKFSPSFFSDHESANKSNDNSFKNTKPPTYKSEFSWSKHLECGIRKPRKLLSINEYSAKMKKRHKKSKQDKLKSVEKQMKHLSYESQKEVNVENKEEQKTESKSVRSQYERPLVSLENQIDSWSKKSVEKEILSEQSVKDEEIKPLVERFKYHANTIVTDVTIRNLTVTIREMPYEDFIDNDTSRYLNIRVPIESEWFTRYGGIIDNETNNDSDFDKEILDDNQCEMSLKFDAKQKLIDRFSENLIPGLRPPSRPRSVDSYKAAIDKNYSGSFSKNLFSVTTSPRKTPAECQLSSNTEPQIPQKSPLHVNIDDCEEVDVVGGIESDHSFVGSLQAETVTMSTEIRQSLPINSNPVTSIIQSLLQSYSYNHSMMMPPLQAAPWLDSHNPSNQIYQLSCHNNKNIDNNPLITNNACLPSRSYEPSVLKYSENTCLSLYQQPTDDLTDIYLSNQGQDTPIDLSLK